ncbi:MAG: DJ-1/PfpI family protein [candidate division WOR-3 bacterium]
MIIRLLIGILLTYALTSNGTAATGQLPVGPAAVAIFIPHGLFRDDEFDAALRILERFGIPAIVVSSDTTAAQGIDGLTVKPQKTLTELRPAEFSALVLVDGSGITAYWHDTLLWRCCQEFAAAGRYVVAIELAPVILARAGVLRNRRATVYPDFYCINVLKAGGARHRFGPVVTDGNVLTASKAENTAQVIRLLVKYLKGNR